MMSDEELIAQKLQNMLEEAKKYVKFDGFEIENIHFKARASSRDFFPFVGRVIDAKSTLEKYPYIKNGTKIPPSKYIYYENLYVLNGLGARGFVLAPYCANLLIEHILYNKAIPEYLDTSRAFLSFARAS
jgi:glycine/D-amino acid oxidase-like deaminating enzyme